MASVVCHIKRGELPVCDHWPNTVVALGGAFIVYSWYPSVNYPALLARADALASLRVGLVGGFYR